MNVNVVNRQVLFQQPEYRLCAPLNVAFTKQRIDERMFTIDAPSGACVTQVEALPERNACRFVRGDALMCVYLAASCSDGTNDAPKVRS